MECINLKERFGGRFKVEFEESYDAERPEFRAAEALWLMVIPCQHGHICPWGGELLAACTNRRGLVARRLVRLAFVKVAHDADDGVNVTFSVQRFPEVAAIMKPRRRRRLSAEHRQKLIEASKPHWFLGGQHGSESGSDERGRVSRVQGDCEAIPARPNAKSVPGTASEHPGGCPATPAAESVSQFADPRHRGKTKS
jgi:hypothetical protein